MIDKLVATVIMLAAIAVINGCGRGDRSSCTSVVASGDSSQASCSAVGDVSNEQTNNEDSTETACNEQATQECLDRGNSVRESTSGDCFKEAKDRCLGNTTEVDVNVNLEGE